MEYAELLQQVQAAAALDRATAERVTLATMVMLAERMHHDELVPLSARLPHELQAALQAGSPTCQPFDADEFVHRVAERVGVEPQAAWTQVRAVLGTLERGGGRDGGGPAAAAARVRRAHGITAGVASCPASLHGVPPTQAGLPP